MYVAKSRNLSVAWAEVLLHILDNPGTEVSPLVIHITEFDNGVPVENDTVKTALETFLAESEKQSVNTVANTIFPQSLWRIAGGDRSALFEKYRKNFPRYKKLEPVKNKRGLYFERLTSYGRGPHNGNQLEYIISTYRAGSKIRMKFQASIFDPERDLDNEARIGFPCLQHITLIPKNGELALNAYYATQVLVEKGYGNYVGLCRLGKFLAEEMGLQLTSFNCFIGNEKLGQITKGSLEQLAQSIRAEVPD